MDWQTARDHGRQRGGRQNCQGYWSAARVRDGYTYIEYGTEQGGRHESMREYERNNSKPSEKDRESSINTNSTVNGLAASSNTVGLIGQKANKQTDK